MPTVAVFSHMRYEKEDKRGFRALGVRSVRGSVRPRLENNPCFSHEIKAVHCHDCPDVTIAQILVLANGEIA